VSYRDAMVDLVRRSGWQRGAELGLGHGHLFRQLLSSVPGLFMVGVDHFRKPAWKASVMGVVSDFPERCQVHGMTTAAAAPRVPDGSLDFVFVDAGHRYESVRKDVALWRSKVRAGGWFGGHDYQPNFPGVIQAVNEAFRDQVQFLAGTTIWWVQA
jgi:hypothetical protein